MSSFKTLPSKKTMDHLSDDDLERYHLGKLKDEAELAALEEHLLVCPTCLARAEEAAQYVDAMRAGLIAGEFDREARGHAPAEKPKS